LDVAQIDGEAWIAFIAQGAATAEARTFDRLYICAFTLP
jgi:hypothetical protein